jgi:hydrogenase/urease accessory protein HupE
MIRLIWLLTLLLCLTPQARADELRPGYIEFSQQSESEWRLVWKAPLRGGVTPLTQPILPKGCSQEGSIVQQKSQLALISTWRVICNQSVTGSKIGLSNFGASQTDVLVRVSPLGRPVQALRLTAIDPEAVIEARPDRWQVARTYFVIGVEHILFGYDHLLFVVLLVILLSGFWTIAKAITAFTLAHSITLVGTTLGVIGLPQRPVEAIIALSILFLAAECVKKREGEQRLSERVPWVVALLFGLLHGFGFAGALKEVGLPEDEVPMALLTFNLGVEAGQLMIVVATLGVMALIRQASPQHSAWAVKTASYAAGSMAGFWLIERLI